MGHENGGWMNEDQRSATPGDEVADQAARIDDLDAPLTPEEEAELKRREGVENALFNAEEVAEAAGFPDLGKAVARLSLLWELGMEEHGLRILDKVAKQVLASLRGEEALDGAGKEE